MYLFIDTETGGVTTEYSLLTVTAIVTDSQFKIVPIAGKSSGITLLIKSAKYVVNATALNINHIDLTLHDKLAISAENARIQFIEYLDAALSIVNRRALVVAGHNVEFDRKFLLAHLITQEDWDKYMTYPFFDTAIIARYFTALGIHDRGYSLSHLVAKLSPDFQMGTMHNSCSDTLATIELAKKMVNMIHDSWTFDD